MPKPTKPEGYITGRPPLDLNPEEVQQVERLAKYLTHAQIAAVLGMSDDTLRRIMRANDSVSMAYKRGRASVVGNVAESLIKNATEKNNVLAQMFFLKCNGWVESQPEQEKPVINISYGQAPDKIERDITPPVQNLDSPDRD